MIEKKIKLDVNYEERNGVVAMIDLLGIKGIWLREEPKQTIKVWGDIKNSLEEVYEIFEEKSPIMSWMTKMDLDKAKIRIFTFSDTIIITLHEEGKEPEDILPQISMIIGYIFANAFMKGKLFRGAISVGKFYQSDDLVIGPSIDDVANWYQSADWCGIHLTPSAYYGCLKTEKTTWKAGFEQYLVKYNVPMKIQQGDIKIERLKTYAVNWLFWGNIVDREIPIPNPERIKNYKPETKTPGDICEEYRIKILKIFSKDSIGIKEESKFRNTLDFINFLLDKKKVIY